MTKKKNNPEETAVTAVENIRRGFDMQKTRLGITVGLLGAAIYFAGFFGGYLTMMILAGYVLLFEENEWLKKTAVKAAALMMFFSLLTTTIELVPSAINFINSVANIINLNFEMLIISKIVTAVASAISIVETVLFIGLGIKALKQETITFPVIDKLIDKYQ